MSAASTWNRGTLVERLYNETPDVGLMVETGNEIQRLRAELVVSQSAQNSPQTRIDAQPVVLANVALTDAQIAAYGLNVAERVRAAFIAGLERRGYLRAGRPLYEHGSLFRDMMDLFDLPAVVAKVQPATIKQNLIVQPIKESLTTEAQEAVSALNYVRTLELMSWGRDPRDVLLAYINATCKKPLQVQLASADDTLGAARAAGRAEAVAIIMQMDPEDPLSDCTSSHECGSTGEWTTQWNVAKLRETFGADDELMNMMDSAEGEYWENLGLREEAERISAAALLAHKDLRGAVGRAIRDEIQRGAQGADWSRALEFDRFAGAAMLVLLERSTHGMHERAKITEDAARWRYVRSKIDFRPFMVGNLPLDESIDAAIDAARSAK